VLSIIDQATDAGCLFLLITGGEPLVREDFPDVYRHARERGLFVTVFTNGTLVDTKTAALFEEFPPVAVEISIYGARAETHDRVTGVPGSHDLSMRAVRLLMARGIRVALKTILMTVNRSELGDMESQARELGLKFRFDAMISPRLDGDKAPLGFRVTPAEAVEGEFSSPARVEQWRKYARRDRPPPSGSDKLYTCGTGISCFHIDPYGGLHPCLMAQTSGYDLTRGPFEDGWRRVVPQIREENAPGDYRCNHCDKQLYCSACPASFQLEGESESYYAFMCAVAEKRSDAILQSV